MVRIQEAIREFSEVKKAQYNKRYRLCLRLQVNLHLFQRPLQNDGQVHKSDVHRGGQFDISPNHRPVIQDSAYENRFCNPDQRRSDAKIQANARCKSVRLEGAEQGRLKSSQDKNGK